MYFSISSISLTKKVAWGTNFPKVPVALFNSLILSSIDLEVLPILNSYEKKGFAIEVWKGHENGGKGFKEFLDSIKEKGLIVNWLMH